MSAPASGTIADLTSPLSSARLGSEDEDIPSSVLLPRSAMVPNSLGPLKEIKELANVIRVGT
jgi:hypothetical protein